MNTQRQLGFSLVEVLIALVILAIGLLGLAALQTIGMRYGHESYQRTQATLLSYDIIDRIRANTDPGARAIYTNVATTDMFTGATSCLRSSPCSPTDMANYDLKQWKQNIQLSLPAGTAQIQPNGAFISVMISWSEHDITMSLVTDIEI